MPAAIVDYFERIDGAGRAGMIGSFTPDAQVIDDGHTYRGRDEILGWLSGAAGQYVTTSTLLSVDMTARAVTVAVRVEGNFPGARVDLCHEFGLDRDGRIGALTIAP